MPETRETTRVMLRPVASPLPLGLIGLAAATILVAGEELRWLPVAQAHQVGFALLVIAVPMQLLAGVIGFLARDAVAATGMASLAVIWLIVGVLHVTGVPGARSKTLGLALFVLGAALLVPAAAAAGKLLATMVLILTATRVVVTGVYQFHGGAVWMRAAGWLGVALCVVALYAALAFELEDMRHRTVLPTLRRGPGRRAIAAAAPDAAGQAGREAGVRDQL